MGWRRRVTAVGCGAVLLLSARVSSLTTHTLGCEGDSQTAVRAGVTDAQTYCARVANGLGWNHLNFAVAGSTSQDVINRLPNDLASAGCCDCFLVQIGANDSFISPSTNASYPPEWTVPLVPPAPGLTDAQFQANLITIAAAVRGAGIPITFLTPWAFFATPDLVQQQFYVDAMKDQAALLVPPVPVVDMFALQLGGVWWNYGNNKPAFWSKYETDYQHPSVDGHAWEAAQFTKPRYAASCAFHN